MLPMYYAAHLKIVLGWEIGWELLVLLAWVRILMLLSDKWAMSTHAPPLVVCKA